MTHNSALRHPEHKEFCNYNQYEYMVPDLWCNCGVGDVPLTLPENARQARVVGIDPETGDEYPIDTVQWAKDIRNAVLDELIEKVKAEPFFPNADGPTHGNAAAFRDYERRIKRIIKDMRRRGG